jgi:hypothetical protein
MKLEKLFSTKEGAQRLNLTMRKLRYFKHAIGFVQLGARIYFRESDLENFFEARRVAPGKIVRRRRWRFLAALRRAIS